MKLKIMKISTGIHNDSNNTDLFTVNNSNNNSPTLLNENNRLGVTFLVEII